MPFLNVKISAQKSPDLSNKICSMLVEHTTEILGKKAELISIGIEYIDPNDWFIAGKSLTNQNKNSFYLVIQITDETNTKAEKAKYIQSVYNGFSEILGNLHSESYIYIEDVRATAYGYGGLTQEYRYHIK